jgi:hypothetical protein
MGRLGQPAVLRAGQDSCTSTASRTLRVMAQAVSSVLDSGMQPCQRCQALGVLESDQALQRGGNADRAAGVRPQRGPGGAGGHRRRRPMWSRRACAASRRCCQRAGVDRRAVVRVDADARERELGGWCGRSARPQRHAAGPRPGSPVRRFGHRPASATPRWLGCPATSNRSLIDTASPASGGSGRRPRARRQRRMRLPAAGF